MVPVTQLILPILVSAAIVFIASSIIHMLLPYHRADMRKVAKEDELLDAVRRLNIPPGDYGSPHPGGREGMKNPQYIEKRKRGPVVLMTVIAGGDLGMGQQLVLWFLYCVLVSLFAAYLAGRAVGPGTEYLEVFRFAGTSAFMGYSLALIQFSIWYKRSWGTTMKSVLDGLVYASLTAGTFGWLWP